MNKTELLKKQNETYKQKTEKNRCIKLYLKNTDELKQFDFVYDLFKYFSRKVFYDLKDGILKITYPRSQADHLYKDEIEYLIKTNGYTCAFIKRQILKQVLERYFSYIKRNKKLPSHVIVLKKSKGLQLYSGCVEIDIDNKNILFYPYLRTTNKKLILSYDYIGNNNYLNNKKCSEERLNFLQQQEKLITSNSGGYISLYGNKAFYVTRIKIPFEWKYNPQGFIGFDLFKSKESFLTFSDKITFYNEDLDIIPKNHPLLKKIEKNEKILKENNASLKDAKNKRSIRLKIKKLHRKLEKLYEKIAVGIVYFMEINELCICLDNINPGKKHGSFGQDKINPLIIKLCENKKIPFVIVPSAYTTRLCSQCNHLHEKIELKIREFVCENCGKTLSRDKNAAINIKNRGNEIWEIGLKNCQEKYYKNYNMLKHS